MALKKGTIEMQSNIYFEDSGKYDPRICHPVVLPITSDFVGEDVYFLVITSQTGKKTIYEDEYFDLNDCWEEIGLRKPSLVNLSHIHKTTNPGSTVAGLRPNIYKDMMTKFKSLHEKLVAEGKDDPYYDEIRNRI